jgi:sRNA-binding protein
MNGAVHGVAATTANAQTEPVYRCGNSYSYKSCAAALSIDVDDSRSDAQRQAAIQVAARDTQLADTLSRERRKRDAAASRQGAAHIGPARTASAPEKTARTKAPRKPDGRRPHEDARLTPPLKAVAPPAS